MGFMLTGERILLRDFGADDWRAVHDYAARPDVCRFQIWGPNTVEESRAYVTAAVARAQEQPRSGYILAVVGAATGSVIGAAGLEVRSQRFRQGEISYIIHPDQWGHGYATEAARLLLAFGFSTLGLHRIVGTCDPRNTASQRVLTKVGMHQEGHLRETLLIRDGWRDSLVHSILEQE